MGTSALPPSSHTLCGQDLAVASGPRLAFLSHRLDPGLLEALSASCLGWVRAGASAAGFVHWTPSAPQGALACPQQVSGKQEVR